jgi:hypothetical protein
MKGINEVSPWVVAENAYCRSSLLVSAQRLRIKKMRRKSVEILNSAPQGVTNISLASGGTSVSNERIWKYSLEFILNPTSIEDYRKQLKLLKNRTIKRGKNTRQLRRIEVKNKSG